MSKRKSSNAGNGGLQVSPEISAVAQKLTMISRSLGAIAVRMAPSRPRKLKDQVHFLNRLGFDRNEVAAILGSTPGSVSVRMSERKKGKRGKGKRRGKN
jgi:CRP-like cAMP-binding protein